MAQTVEKTSGVILSREAVVQTATVPSTRWNAQIRKAVESLGVNLRTGQEIHIELVKNNLIIAKYGMYRIILNEGNVIVDRCESVTVLENEWLVVSRHGIYYLYDKAGNPYKGLSFLKKENAIRFAKTL